MGAVCTDTGLGTVAVIISPGICALICNDTEASAVNSTRYKSLIIKNAEGKTYRVVNCMGEEIAKGTIDGKLCEVEVPLSGIVFVK